MATLVRRLRSSDFEQQLQALDSLNAACRGGPEACQAAAAAGAIPLVVRLLRSRKPAVQATAACALHKMGECAEELLPEMRAAGALPALVALLRSSSDPAQTLAACALSTLCYRNVEATQAAAAAGGIPAAVQMLCSGSKEAVAAALGLLSSFSTRHSEEVSAAVGANARAIPRLVRLLDPARQRTAKVVSSAVSTLSVSALWSKELALACIEAGALPRLAQLAGAADEVFNPGSALFSLAKQCPAETAAEPSTIPALVHIMESSRGAPALIQAAQGLYCLAAGSPQRSQAITEAGGSTALVRLQYHANPEVRAHAGRALAELQAAAELHAAARADPAGAARMSSSRRVCAAEGCVATRGLKRCARCSAVRYCR